MDTMQRLQIAEYIADHINGSAWEIADQLVAEFTPTEYPADNGVNSGLYAKLEEVSDVLRKEYGIELKTRRLRQQRATALKFPAVRRQTALSFFVHETVRDERELDKWMRSAEKEGVTLTATMVGRYRADEKRVKDGVTPPAARVELLEKRIRAATISVYLGSRIITQDDWWNGHGFTDEKRKDIVWVLRDLADRINP